MRDVVDAAEKTEDASIETYLIPAPSSMILLAAVISCLISEPSRLDNWLMLP